MEPTLNPGSRPRWGIVAILVAVGLFAAIVGVAVLGSPGRADASGLEAFSSCGELRSWGAAAQQEQAKQTVGGVMRTEGGDVAMSGGPATTVAPVPEPASADSSASRTGTGSGTGGADTGSTNVAVAGVDELDVIDQLEGDRELVSAGSHLSIVDLGSRRVVAQLPEPADAQVTYDPAAKVAWVVGMSEDGTGVRVQRVAVGQGSLTAAGSWTTKGMLVDARRVGDRLHLVASDGFMAVTGEDALPFGGTAVPCAQVLHPTQTSDPTATLLVSLPVRGPLQPEHSAEVVGSGQLVHVTTDAAYLATPQWDGAGTTTTIHRFDLADLTHTGSGRVQGTLLNQYAMSDRDGHLRVAITRPTQVVMGGPGGGPIAVDDVASAPPEGGPELQAPETTVPDTTVPDTTPPETVVPVPTSTTSVETTTTTEPATTTTQLPTTTTEPTTTTTVAGPGPDDPLNRVVVLDTSGDLDVEGQTPWFGHPGETLQGIRFDGATAYAVTYLNTDPFYVLDLADPAAPKVAGQVELPGFSSYLHPMGNAKVVGFGPGADGQQEAKLFDVSDPSAPKLLDTLTLGMDSPVAYDPHAFVSLGSNRFAVPVSTYGVTPLPCNDFPERPTTDKPVAPDEPIATDGPMTTDGTVVAEGPNTTTTVVQEEPGGSGSSPSFPGGGPDIACGGYNSWPQSSVVEVRVAGGHLEQVQRRSVQLDDVASRVIPVGDGWALLAAAQLAVIDGRGTLQGTVALG